MAGNRMVGMTGFEPATSCSQSRRATKLRHIPTLHSGIDYSRRIEIRRKDFPSDRRHFSRRARPPLWPRQRPPRGPFSLTPLPSAAPYSSPLPPPCNHRPLTRLAGLLPLSTRFTKVITTIRIYAPHFFTSNITWRVILSTLLVIALSNSIGMRLPISSLILVGRRGRNHEISKKATRRVQTHRSSLRGRGLDVWGIGDYPPKPLLRIFPGQRISPQH